MRYMIPKQFWTCGARFEIFDEDRRILMTVRDPEFSWDHHWTIEDSAQNKLAYTNQEMQMSSVEYIIHKDDAPWISIPGSAFDSRINELDLDGPNDYRLVGKFWQLDYSVRCGDQIIATVGQHRWSHAKMLSVETNDEDDFSVLMIVMCVEQILNG